MSYDISLFTTQPDLSIEESFELKCCSENESGFAAAEKGMTRELLRVIQDSIPILKSIETDEMLALIDNESGLEVIFFGVDNGAVSFPYWHEKEDMVLVVHLAKVLRILGQKGKYWAHDSQLGRYLDLSEEEALAAYIQQVFVSNQETVKLIKQWFK